LTQDRLCEKTFVEKLGLKTAPFFEVSSGQEARAAFDKLNGSAILKTRRFGYDGKGQAKVASAQEAAQAFDSFKGVPSILEGFVEFSYEASVVAARGHDGSFAAYDPPKNEHENHILRRSSVPSPMTRAEVQKAQAIAARIAEELQYVGVLAVELFIAKNGDILVNEIAPRVHNTGHWTIEACQCSQFEQHVRAVAGWPLGDPSRHADAVMENVIGAEADAWQTLAKTGALHLYGKDQVRPGRKMGHVTCLRPLTKG
jgi:5-(carboxyamino)imidazole ribonucleotide synthase